MFSFPLPLCSHVQATFQSLHDNSCCIYITKNRGFKQIARSAKNILKNLIASIRKEKQRKKRRVTADIARLVNMRFLETLSVTRPAELYDQINNRGCRQTDIENAIPFFRTNCRVMRYLYSGTFYEICRLRLHFPIRFCRNDNFFCYIIFHKQKGREEGENIIP